MKKESFDHLVVDVTCARCGMGHRSSVAYFRGHSVLNCTKCGTDVLENQAFQASITEFSMVMARLIRSYIQ